MSAVAKPVPRSESKIIGGMFGIAEPLSQPPSQPPFLKTHNLDLANARSALWVLLNRLSPQTIWLPSYLCEVVLQAVPSQTQIRFYAVDGHLRVLSGDTFEGVGFNDVVLIIDYFGFRPRVEDLSFLRDRGAWLVEDACQALLTSDVGLGADFTLYSPRKFLGVPDGGILACDTDWAFVDAVLEDAPADWCERTVSAANARREFDQHGGERHWFDLFQKTESESPVGPYAMSELSRDLLVSAFDYSSIVKRRVRNYQYLADELAKVALFQALPSGAVPLGFPVRVKRRDRIRQALFAENIYPPIHWKIVGIVPEEFVESHSLADEIMTLPCDQRYDLEDMKRMVRVFRKAISS